MPFYNQERVFVGANELWRVQTASSSFTEKRVVSGHIGGNKTYNTNVQEMLTAALTFQYVGYEAYNEGIMGFSGDFVGKLISGADIKNYSIQISGGGTINTTGAALTSYTVSMGIEQYPQHTVSFDVFEMGYQSSTTVSTPNIFATGSPTPAILPGNIDAQLSGACGIASFSLQDVSLSVSVNREYSTYAGYKTPAIKRVTFPMEAKVTMTAYLDGFKTGDINSYFDITSGLDVRVIYKNKQSVNTNGGFRLTNAFITHQEIANEAMDRTKISLEFSANLGIVDSKTSPKSSLYIGI